MRRQAVRATGRVASRPRQIRHLCLERGDGTLVVRPFERVLPSTFTPRQLEALRTARSALRRELRDNPIGGSRWAKQLLADVDDALAIATGASE